MSEYRLTLGRHSITWGERIDIDRLIGELPNKSYEPSEDNGEWDLPNGVYRAKDVVRELGVLLTAIRVQLGQSTASELLLDNLEASLAIAGREAVLPLNALVLGDTARSELAAQVQSIGVTLTRWAREFDSQEWALNHYGETALANLTLRSRCDQHLWTPQVAQTLTGPAGGPALMQLFNEYLHQFVLLRDALIPFDNWEEVPIALSDRGSAKGLRYLEQAHTEFLSEFLVKKMSHKALVRFAQSVLSPELSNVGYGFQYQLGTILPASLGGVVSTAPRYLLHWHPAAIITTDPSATQTSIAFEYAFEDYYSVLRSQAGEGSQIPVDAQDQELQNIHEAQLVITKDEAEHVYVQYQLWIGSTLYTIDLGQALRGHRFMYRPKLSSKSSAALSPGDQTGISRHRSSDILGLPGLVSNEKGNHFISAGGNPLVLWALLGKLYPENVIVLDNIQADELAAARGAGKGFGTKFLIH
jgi:hypothetical protein